MTRSRAYSREIRRVRSCLASALSIRSQASRFFPVTAKPRLSRPLAPYAWQRACSSDNRAGRPTSNKLLPVITSRRLSASGCSFTWRPPPRRGRKLGQLYDLRLTCNPQTSCAGRGSREGGRRAALHFSDVLTRRPDRDRALAERRGRQGRWALVWVAGPNRSDCPARPGAASGRESCGSGRRRRR
jgi:hypothetical protein